MKRCSTCNRTYTDPNLSFCIDDGTPLTTVETDDDTTVVRPRDTAGHIERDNADDEWNAMAYRPPGSYVPPGTEVKPRRRVWPWVVGLGGAFIFGILVIAIAALIVVPRMMREREREHPRITVRQPENSNTNTPETTSNNNSNTTEGVDARPPADREQVLAQLKDLENEWTVANLNADKKKLERILADDYAGQASEEGGLQSKAEYIDSIERDSQVEKWEFSDLNLVLAGDRATLTGIITYFVRDRSVSFDFKDRFVWRDGRWQATGAELKRRGNVGTDL
jgi:hypothetical protein